MPERRAMTATPARRRLLEVLDLRIEETIACVLIVLMTICVLLQVFSRYVLDLGVHWTEEVAAYCMVWAVYLGAVIGIRHHFHIRMILLVQKLPRALGLPLVLLGDAIWVGFNVLMIAYATEYLTLLLKFTNRSPALGIEQEWPHAIVLIAYVLMTARIVQTYVIWWQDGFEGLPTREHDAEEEMAAQETAAKEATP